MGLFGDMRIYVRAVGVVVDLSIPITTVPRHRAIDGMRLWRGRTTIVSIGERYRAASDSITSPSRITIVTIPPPQHPHHMAFVFS